MLSPKQMKSAFNEQVLSMIQGFIALSSVDQPAFKTEVSVGMPHCAYLGGEADVVRSLNTTVYGSLYEKIFIRDNFLPL